MLYSDIMECLYWRNNVREGEEYGVGRSFFSARPMGMPHCHDFVELWWVDEGSGQHLVNGVRVPVQCGDLVLMRPEDGHAYGDGDFAITNIFFPSATLAHLRTRYFSDDETFWGGASTLPRTVHLPVARLHPLRLEAERLARERKTLLRIERFLLNLLDELPGELTPPSPLPLPAWLQQACREIHTPAHLRLGAGAFYQLAGKSPEHVARVVRQFLRTTPQQLVTEARMAHAAMLLEMTPRPIIDIADECGYESLSRFYRVFKDTYRMTPRGYRRRMLHV